MRGDWPIVAQGLKSNPPCPPFAKGGKNSDPSLLDPPSTPLKTEPAESERTLSLDELLRRTPQLWRGRGAIVAEGAVLPTGFPALDRALGGGWPAAALAEIIVPTPGLGELTLLLPAMRRVQGEGRHLAWIAPPHVPYAPALADAGLDVRRLLLVEGLAGDRELWWSFEKLLRSAACGLVLAWPRRPGSVAVLRRLQLAAAEGQCLGVLLAAGLPSGSPAALRLKLEAAERGLRVHVLKRRGLADGASVWLER